VLYPLVISFIGVVSNRKGNKCRGPYYWEDGSWYCKGLCMCVSSFTMPLNITI